MTMIYDRAVWSLIGTYLSPEDKRNLWFTCKENYKKPLLWGIAMPQFSRSIWLNLIPYLDTTSKYRLWTSCKYIYKLNNLFWRTVHLSKPSVEKMALLSKIRPYRLSYDYKIYPYFSGFDYGQPLCIPDSITHIGPHMRYYYNLSKLPRLESVDIRYPYGDVIYTRLTKLAYNQSEYICDVSSSTCLTNLKIRYNRFLTQDMFDTNSCRGTAICNSFPLSLKKLRLKQFSHGGNHMDLIIQSLTYLTNLTHLDFKARTITHQGLNTLSGFTSLTHLGLNECRFTQFDFTLLCPKLTSFQCQSIIQSPQFIILGKHLTNLRKLTLTQSRIINKDVIRIAPYLTRLTHLILPFDLNLTKRSLSRLVSLSRFKSRNNTYIIFKADETYPWSMIPITP